MPVSSQQISEVRAFNRDYTRRIGVLSQGLLDSPYSLTQVRVMYEIAHRPGITAGELGAELGLDRGYLSRILKGFAAQRLLARATLAADARRRPLRLTVVGRRVFAPLERRSQQQVRAMLSGLDGSRRAALLEAMSVIRCAFRADGSPAKVSLRTHRPGDMGWVVERHGVLYARDFCSIKRRHTIFDCDWSSDVCSSDLHSGHFDISRETNCDHVLFQTFANANARIETTSHDVTQSVINHNVEHNLRIGAMKSTQPRRNEDRKGVV